MNDYDERLKLPPPEDCMGCARRQTMVTLGVARHWCASGHLMHPGCGFRVPATEGQMHRDGDVMARPVTVSNAVLSGAERSAAKFRAALGDQLGDIDGGGGAC